MGDLLLLLARRLLLRNQFMLLKEPLQLSLLQAGEDHDTSEQHDHDELRSQWRVGLTF